MVVEKTSANLEKNSEKPQEDKMAKVQTGIEEFIDNPPEWVSGKRLGLLCNPASVDRNFCHTRELICKKFPGQLTALFSPQHGFFAEKQDNMIESDDMTDPVFNIPIFSLYSKTRKPAKKMFDLLKKPRIPNRSTTNHATI